MALAVSKHIEIKAGVSIRKFLDESKKIVDGQIFDQMTNKAVSIKAQPLARVTEIMDK